MSAGGLTGIPAQKTPGTTGSFSQIDLADHGRFGKSPGKSLSIHKT
jgi:hypothetical protein